MKTNKLKGSVLTLLFLLFIGCIQSCSTEESVLENDAAIKTVTKEEAILFLKKQETAISISGKKASLTFDFNKITQEKLTNTSELLTVVPVINKTKNQRTRALLLKVENSIETILYNEYSDASSTKNNFTGIILMTKLNGDFIRAYRLKNNEYDVELAPAKGSKTSKLFSSKDVIAMEELNEVIIINNYKKPFPYVSINEMGKEIPIDDLYWNSLGGGSTGDSDETAQITEDRINDDKLIPCPQNILRELKDQNLNDVTKILKDLGNDQSILITFESGYANGKPAISKPDGVCQYKIIISTDYTTSTRLFRASNILHEIIHVQFMNIVYNFKLNGYPEKDYDLNKFSDLFQAFCDKNRPPTDTEKEDAHHLEMANKYVTSIAKTLEEFNRTNDPLGLVKKQVYEDLAWGGLKDTPVYDAKFPINSLERKRIEDRYRIESNGSIADEGTVTEQKPAGEPCK